MHVAQIRNGSPGVGKEIGQDVSQDGFEPPTRYGLHSLINVCSGPLSYWLKKNSISKASFPKVFPLKLNYGNPNRFCHTGWWFISGEPTSKVHRLRRVLLFLPEWYQVPVLYISKERLPSDLILPTHSEVLRRFVQVARFCLECYGPSCVSNGNRPSPPTVLSCFFQKKSALSKARGRYADYNV